MFSTLRRRGRRWCQYSAVTTVAAVISLAGTACEAQPGHDPQPGVTVQHYDVDLHVDVADMTVRGRASINLVLDDVETLHLALDGPSIDSVLVNGRSARYRHHRNALSVVMPSAADSVVVTVFYAGQPRVGLYRGSAQGRTVVFTDGWPTRVSGWLPGVHHPSIPATLDLRLSHSGDGVAVGSGRPLGRDGGATAWRLDAPAPTYAFAFAIAPFQTHVDTSAVHYHFEEELQGGLSRTSRILETIEDLLGPYPYRSLSTVAVPFDYAGMENASSAFLNTNLYVDATALEGVLVHELVHQWFGNHVTIADWRDLWISEGITTYLVSVVYESLDGIDAAREVMAEMASIDRRQARSAPPVVPIDISTPEDMLTWVVYRKGGAMMHTLRLVIGDDAFFETLRRLIATYAPGPVSTAQVIDAFQAAASTDLSDFFEFWLTERRFAALELSWDDASETLSWNVSGDDGTLESVPFELEIAVDGAVWYVNRVDESIYLPGITGRPSVRPVGVMMTVHWNN
jgi:aminopeptidase N